MIDWHSHVLPGMDDGSHSSDESLAILRSMADQGVDTVIATPHFYANHEKSVESFLSRRAASENRLRERMAEVPNLPRLICGAEVRYYPGISHMTDLERLTIGNSRLLLLEMSFDPWSEYTVREILQMLSDERFTVVLAHIDRYWKLQSNRTHKRLLENRVSMQLNAEALLRMQTRRKSLRLLESKSVRYIGSDAHNMTSRPPEIGDAYAIIQKKLGAEFVERLDGFGHRMLEES